MKTKGKSISIIPSSLATVAQALAKLSATPCLFSYKAWGNKNLWLVTSLVNLVEGVDFQSEVAKKPRLD